MIKVAKAERNGTALGDSISVQSSGEALTEGVTQHSWAHGQDISEKLHEARVAIKGDAPAELAASINHGREDMLRKHGAFAEGLACVGNPAGLVGGGDAASIKEADRQTSFSRITAP